MKSVTEYTVKYKLTGDLFWKKIKDVIGDDTMFRYNRGEGKAKPGEDTLPIRVFFIKGGARFELPMNNTVISFPKERQIMIEESIKEGKDKSEDS